MNGWLIYDKKGAERNGWFIEKLIAEFAALGHTLHLKIVEDGWGDEGADFVIVRTINPKINAYFEAKKVPVFNGEKVARVACDKWQTYLFCKENHIPVMETKLLGEEKPFPFPFVVKSRDGHGGSEVFLIADERAWQERKAEIDISRFIAQPLCDEQGKDMRVYLLGDKVLAAMLRASTTDFRSNYSLGGRAEKTEISPSQKEVLERITTLLSPDFCGVDFIRHNGAWILNELEDSVGTRMLYKHTEIDAVKEYAYYVAKKLQ